MVLLEFWRFARIIMIFTPKGKLKCVNLRICGWRGLFTPHILFPSCNLFHKPQYEATAGSLIRQLSMFQRVFLSKKSDIPAFKPKRRAFLDPIDSLLKSKYAWHDIVLFLRRKNSMWAQDSPYDRQDSMHTYMRLKVGLLLSYLIGI